ncbi:hypothetical protein H5410_061293, partial [Solanum commersonii]
MLRGDISKKLKRDFLIKIVPLRIMLEKCPDDILECQFRQLIEYWKHPTVQRATKQNNEEPSKSEMFIATRTKTGKEIQADTQVAINHQNSGETADDAFMKDEETNNLKENYANEVTSLKEEMNDMIEEMRHFFSQLLQKNPGLNVRDMPGCVGSNIASSIDAGSAQVVKGQNLPHSFGSTHDPVLQKADIVGLALSSLVVNQ